MPPLFVGRCVLLAVVHPTRSGTGPAVSGQAPHQVRHASASFRLSTAPGQAPIRKSQVWHRTWSGTDPEVSGWAPNQVRHQTGRRRYTAGTLAFFLALRK